MLSDDKITEIYYMADDLCKFFSGNVKKHTIEENDGKDTGTDLSACHNHHGDVPLQRAVCTTSSSTPSPI